MVSENDVIDDTNYKKNDSRLYKCVYCDKTYGSRNGLWKHHKICGHKTSTGLNHDISPIDSNYTGKSSPKKIEITEEFLLFLIQQNKDLMDIVKSGSFNQPNHSSSNSNNQAFNLNFFLNEKCKGENNSSEFVDTVKVDLHNIERFDDNNKTNNKTKEEQKS
jgi:hypothetical protein